MEGDNPNATTNAMSARANTRARASERREPAFGSTMDRGAVLEEDPTRPDEERWTSRRVSRILSGIEMPVTAIHLGLPLPTSSSGLPAGSGGPPSNACASRDKPGSS
jgi:hypothetical protein